MEINLTKSAKETQKIGAAFAKKILKNTAESSQAIIVGLRGDLGSGKTTFLQGFAKGLGIKEKILSPTFVILKRFSLKGKKHFKNFYHIDCYRLQIPEEILDLNWNEIILNPENVIAIEWPEKIEKLLPKNIIEINHKFIDEQSREIKI